MTTIKILFILSFLLIFLIGINHAFFQVAVKKQDPAGNEFKMVRLPVTTVPYDILPAINRGNSSTGAAYSYIIRPVPAVKETSIETR